MSIDCEPEALAKLPSALPLAPLILATCVGDQLCSSQGGSTVGRPQTGGAAQETSQG